MKIINLNQAENQLKELKKRNIVLVGGCFDLLHYGHVRFLQEAKKEGDFLIIALESDEFIKKSKKRSPIHNQHERAQVLASLNMVDLVILLPFLKTDSDYERLVRIINPQVIAVTEGDPKCAQKIKQADAVGAKITIKPLIKKFSSSKIICDYS